MPVVLVQVLLFILVELLPVKSLTMMPLMPITTVLKANIDGKQL
jgi:hypothetical protein